MERLKISRADEAAHKDKKAAKADKSSMEGIPYRFGKDGSKQYEGIPYRFGKDGSKQYRPDLAPKNKGLLKGLGTKH